MFIHVAAWEDSRLIGKLVARLQFNIRRLRDWLLASLHLWGKYSGYSDILAVANSKRKWAHSFSLLLCSCSDAVSSQCVCETSKIMETCVWVQTRWLDLNHPTPLPAQVKGVSTRLWTKEHGRSVSLCLCASADQHCGCYKQSQIQTCSASVTWPWTTVRHSLWKELSKHIKGAEWVEGSWNKTSPCKKRKLRVVKLRMKDTNERVVSLVSNNGWKQESNVRPCTEWGFLMWWTQVFHWSIISWLIQFSGTNLKNWQLGQKGWIYIWYRQH